MPETITKYFRRAGVLSADLEAITCGNDKEDPFLEADAQTEIHSLITETTPNDTCPVNEYLSGDDDLAVCVLE